MAEDKALIPWEERLANEAKNVASMERPSITGMSFRSGMMSINDVPVPGNKLNIVVLASAVEHALYTKPYDPNVIVPPDCFALAIVPTDGSPRPDMIPHSDVPEPRAEACDICEFFKWSSDPRPGSKGKACKEKRRLVFIPATSVADGEIEKSEVAMCGLPVTSVKNWGNYVNRCAAEFGRPPWAMLTEISVVPDMRTQFQVKFEAKGLVNSEYLDALHKKAQTSLNVLLTPYDMTQQAPPAAPSTGSKKF